MWLKKGTQIQGEEQKFFEIQSIIQAKLSRKYIDVQFQPISCMEIYTLEIENEPRRPKIKSDNQGKYIFAKFWSS